MNRVAIYAGTFDPLTLGHMDLIRRASRIFERLILAVARSQDKNPLFSLEERLLLVQQSVADLENVEVEPFEGLLVSYAQQKGVHVLVRGLRAFSDFEFEFQMALTNRKMAPALETLFLMPKEEYSYISSSAVREIAELGGDTSMFVPPPVEAAFRERFGSSE